MAKLNAQGKSAPAPDPARASTPKDDLKATLALSSDDLNALLEEVKKFQNEGGPAADYPEEPTDPSPVSEILASKEPAPAQTAPAPRSRFFSKLSRSG
jgi:hypothetical protein